MQDTIPYLELPLRVGIAFVPGQSGRSAISEATKIQLLDNVKAGFVDREYIEHIEVIPDTYLRSSKGINGMQQVARLYGVDVMALVSYDQVAVSEDNPASFLYWTIVGSYVIKATSNEVQTFVDTAVFDVKTARLLFRAPGLDKMSDRSTLIESGEVVRKTRDSSFAAAMGAMTQNLARNSTGSGSESRRIPASQTCSGNQDLTAAVLSAGWRGLLVAGARRGARLICNRRWAEPLQVFQLVQRVERLARRHRVRIDRRRPRARHRPHASRRH